MADEFEDSRKQMVERQLIPRGIHSPAVLKAMSEIPRHDFVPQSLRHHAYADGPLAIGEGQTISQPYIVALMIQEAQLNPNSVVLEIGTGSGYAAAVLSKVCKEVYTIERLPNLAVKAQEKLKDYPNVHVITGDGTLGLPSKQPFDAIITTAGGPTVPQTLVHQLKEGGILIIPIGDAYSQELIRVKTLPGGKLATEILEYVRFVPLIGEEGWKE